MDALITPILNRAAHFIPTDVLTPFPVRLIKPLIKLGLMSDEARPSDSHFWEKF